MRTSITLGLLALTAGSLYTHSALAAVQIDRLPFTADQAGETYVLSGDLNLGSGRAITVAADDVIIDGAGHTITYANSGPGNGIYVSSPVTSLEVKNLTLNQGSYEPNGGEDVHGIVVRGNHRGLDIHDNTININHGGAQSGAYGWGMSLTGNDSRSWGNRIAHNTINIRTTSAGYGIYIDPNAPWQGHINGNTVRLYDMHRIPAGYGRAIAIGGRGPIEIHDNEILLDESLQDAVQGISLWNGDGHIIRDNVIRTAGYKTRSILIDGDSDDNLVARNKIYMTSQHTGGETSAGIRIRYGSDRTMVYMNEVYAGDGNDSFPLRIGGDEGMGQPQGTVVRNNLFRSKSRAISIEAGSDIVFYNNEAISTGPEWSYALYVYSVSDSPSRNLEFNNDSFTGRIRFVGTGVTDVDFCSTNVEASQITDSTGSAGYDVDSSDCTYPSRDVPSSPTRLSPQ